MEHCRCTLNADGSRFCRLALDGFETVMEAKTWDCAGCFCSPLETREDLRSQEFQPIFLSPSRKYPRPYLEPQSARHWASAFYDVSPHQIPVQTAFLWEPRKLPEESADAGGGLRTAHWSKEGVSLITVRCATVSGAEGAGRAAPVWLDPKCSKTARNEYAMCFGDPADFRP